MKAKQANRILRSGHFFSGFENLLRIDKEEFDRQIDIHNRYFSVNIPGSYNVGSFMCTPKIMASLFGYPIRKKNCYLHWYFGGVSSSLIDGMDYNKFEYEGDVLIPLSIIEVGRSDYDKKIHKYNIGAHDKLSNSCVDVITGIVTTHLLMTNRGEK